MQTQTDEQLLGQIQDGNENAFVALFRRRNAGVYRFAFTICGRKDWAEEIVQEVFVALMNSSQALNPDKGSVQSWLYSVARNQARKRLEKESRYVALNQEDEQGFEFAESLGTQENVLDALTHQERLEALDEAIAALPSPFREVLVLCDLEEAPYDVAATLLACPIGTIRSRLSRARGMLAVKLRAQEPCKS